MPENKKITELPDAAPPTGDEYQEWVQGGVNVKGRIRDSGGIRAAKPYDLSANVYPPNDGSGPGGAIRAGDRWYVSNLAGGNLDLGVAGPEFVPYKSYIEALVNTPGTDPNSWRVY